MCHSDRVEHAKSYLTPNEVAALLMVAPGTVRVWSEKGLLHAQTTVGGHRRYAKEEVERFVRERDAAQASPASLRVLIVDDDPAVPRYLAAWLGGLDGIVVETAQDGFEAGKQLYAFKPDVVLLDLMMPGLDGFQVCRMIKEDAATRHVRVLALTGRPTAENVVGILAAGAEACLAKPIDEAALLAAIRAPRAGLRSGHAG